MSPRDDVVHAGTVSAPANPLYRFLLLLAPAMVMAAGGHADAGAAVRKSVEALYQALATRDAASLASFLPSGGFTEFSPPEHGIKTLDVGYFQRAWNSGVRIELHVEHPGVQVLRGSAIVTGNRVGAILWPDGKQIVVNDCMTMVWSRDDRHWTLRHVHISPCGTQ